MKRLSSNTVKLTKAERVVVDWFNALLRAGLSPRAASQDIIDSVPPSSTTMDILRDPEFLGWLIGPPSVQR